MTGKAVVTVYVRHRASCSDEHKGEFFRGCDCPKWVRYSLNGKRHRVPTGTATWGIAEEKAADLQKRLNAGEDGVIIPAAKPTKTTIEDAMQTFITAKRGEAVSEAVMKKYKNELPKFQAFLQARSKYFPAEITAADLIDYRDTWQGYTKLTRRNFQTRLKTFLRFIDMPEKEIRKLRTVIIKAKDRPKPEPFTEEELKRLLATIPTLFTDNHASRVTALVRFMVSTGLAIRDTVQLERSNIQDGWLTIKRQKTDKRVRQKLEAGLLQEVMTVLNGNPKYVFWNTGTGSIETAVQNWQHDIRRLMKAAGVYKKGNLSHRFRDTAALFWKRNGCSITKVATMLGDTEEVVRDHYYPEGLMDDQLETIPQRQW